MKKLISLLILSCFAVAVASAIELYNTDFISADGFTEGADINGVDGWTAQTELDSTNVGGNGELTWSSNFTRGYIAGTAFAVGDTITITTDIKSLGGMTPAFDANIFQLGLTDNADLGSTSVRVGLMLGAGSTGSNWNIGEASFIGSDHDTSVAIDTAFHSLTTTIKKTATTNEFIVTRSLDAFEMDSSTIINSDLYEAATVYTLVFAQGQSQTGGIALDNLNVSIVPEPSTYTLLAGLSALAFVMVRRRK